MPRPRPSCSARPCPKRGGAGARPSREGAPWPFAGGAGRALRARGRLNGGLARARRAGGGLARRADGEGREVLAGFARALAPATIWDGRAADNVLGVFGASAAGRGVERVDGDALVGGDAPARLTDGAVGERVLGGAPA